MSDIAVVASGMVTAVGFNAPATCAAIRAGISGATQVLLWDFEAGDYLNGAKVNLPHWCHGVQKLADLVAPAVNECLIAARPVAPRDIPIFLGVAEPGRPMREAQFDRRILEAVENRLETTLHPDSAVLPYERVSGVVGLQQCRKVLERLGLLYCIVAGVDSFLLQEVADVFMHQRRLLTPTNSNGFIPGEAGAAILIRDAAVASTPQLRILGTGLAHELATISSEEPLRGDGMAKAIGDALAESGVTIFDTSYRITDINGEHYKFKEALLAITRFQHTRRKDKFGIWHPIECVGEIGAAVGPCVLALALHAGQHRYAPGDTALCHFSNDGGERAAVVVRYEGGGRPS